MTEPRQASADPRGEDTQRASRLESSLDTSQAHIARVYDYWLGGKDNFAADRAAGDAVIQAYPGVIATVRANRALLARMVRYLVGEAGIDVGTAPHRRGRRPGEHAGVANRVVDLRRRARLGVEFLQ